MAEGAMKLGLLLPNQGVVFGATTVPELIELAEAADQSGVFDTVFVGDNLLAKPRLESVTTLSALAVRTSRVRLGTACMASFPVRDPILLAAQWGVLDNLSGGRALLVTCIGGAGGGQNLGGRFEEQFRAFHIDPKHRMARLEEGIEVLRVLWSQDPAQYEGVHFQFENIAVRPPPVQKPTPPIWIANTPSAFADREKIFQRMVNRVGRLADGWMTNRTSPSEFRDTWQAIRAAAAAHGRDPEKLESSLLLNLNIDEDAGRAFDETKRFLDEYYGTDSTREQVDKWSAYGPAEHCAAAIRQFAAVGCHLLCVRPTSYNQMEQLHRFVRQVAPLL